MWGCCLHDSQGSVPGVHVLGDASWRRPTRPAGRCVAVISRSRASGEVGDALQRLREPGTAPKEGAEGAEGTELMETMGKPWETCDFDGILWEVYPLVNVDIATRFRG